MSITCDSHLLDLVAFLNKDITKKLIKNII